MTEPAHTPILILTADGFEDSELLTPLEALRAAGHPVHIASLATGELTGKHGARVRAEHAVADLRAADYAALVLPGGHAPERLRHDPAVQALVRDFVAQGKPVAAICHGPQILLSAGVLAGRRATGYRAIHDELRRGGVKVEDAPVVVDGNLITSRHPGDLPDFVAALRARLEGEGEKKGE